MLTQLLQRVMREHADWSAQMAYNEVQRRVSRVTVVPWRDLVLVTVATNRSHKAG